MLCFSFSVFVRKIGSSFIILKLMFLITVGDVKMVQAGNVAVQHRGSNTDRLCFDI